MSLEHMGQGKESGEEVGASLSRGRGLEVTETEKNFLIVAKYTILIINFYFYF